ncbi:hypothetical protein G6F40_016016 [Rhizopus arrhizus]|nr:hypothetical protein G6F40_016016 [Rhizopus arrhizus]
MTPTRALFEALAEDSGATVDVRLVDGAWNHFKAGDTDAYLRAIANAAQDAYAQGADAGARAHPFKQPGRWLARGAGGSEGCG